MEKIYFLTFTLNEKNAMQQLQEEFKLEKPAKFESEHLNFYALPVPFEIYQTTKEIMKKNPYGGIGWYNGEILNIETHKEKNKIKNLLLEKTEKPTKMQLIYNSTPFYFKYSAHIMNEYNENGEYVNSYNIKTIL